MLLLVKGHIIFLYESLPRIGFHVQQPINGLSFQDSLRYYLRDILYPDSLVEYALRVNSEKCPSLAEARTACGPHINLVLESALLNLIPEGGDQVQAAVGKASGTGTYGYTRLVGVSSTDYRLPEVLKFLWRI